MAFEKSLNRVGKILDAATRRQLLADAYQPKTPLAISLARLGISPAELEAALSGQPVSSMVNESAGGEARSPMLEAIVLRFGRPSYLIKDDLVDWSTGSAFVADNVDFESVIKPRINAIAASFRGIGRVNAVNHPTLDWIGTGWIVQSEKGPIAITNRHVAEEFATLRGGHAVFRYDPRSMLRRGAEIDFKAEYKSSDSVLAEVRGVRFLASPHQPDIAILELQDTGALAAGLELSDVEAKAGDIIVTAGYPARDSRNAADAQADIFREVYNFKRVAPGLIRQAAAPGRTLTHDASTLGGASGSPLIDLDSGKVIGLHFSGAYLEANTAVSVASINTALAGGFTVSGAASAPESVGVEGRRDGQHPATHFDNRIGYQPDFLANGGGIAAGDQAGLSVPLPSPPTGELARLVHTPDDHELRYTHFSVLYHQQRRTPRLTGVNIDGGQAQKIVRGDDQWFADLRLDPSIQLTQKDYVGDFDRGHMVRREDPNWGTRADAVLADSDTFHYTNAALQHAQLNRSKQRWLGLEDYILRSTQTYGFRACVFAGPVLADSDPVIEGREDLKVPLAFWKVVVMIAADRKSLHATGYILGQADFVRTITESFEFGDFNAFQVPIAKIAHQTGIDFHGLERADPLADRAETEAVAGGVIPLEFLEDIIL